MKNRIKKYKNNIENNLLEKYLKEKILDKLNVIVWVGGTIWLIVGLYGCCIMNY